MNCAFTKWSRRNAISTRYATTNLHYVFRSFCIFYKTIFPRSIWLMSLCNYEFAFFVLLVLYFFYQTISPSLNLIMRFCNYFWKIFYQTISPSLNLIMRFCNYFWKRKTRSGFCNSIVTLFFMGIINILYNNCYVSRRLEMKVKMTHSNEICFFLIRLAKSHPFLWNVNLHKRLVFSCFYHSLNECVAQQVR